MAKLTESIHNCPNCKSTRVNKVSWSNFYCKTCDCEFNKNGEIFIIQMDGELVPLNDFSNIA